MPNSIKYNVSAETLALKKGNFWIGTGDVGKGPTSSTGYYNGITPPSGGYTIYLNKATGGPSIYTVTTEAQMVSLTNTIGVQSFTTSGQCLNWFATQTDKMIFNIDYPAIVTSGLVLNLDAGFTPSYPTTATTWYDVSSGGNNGTLTNGPTFNSDNSGSIVFDGVDDYVNLGDNSVFNFSGSVSFTCTVWANITSYGRPHTAIVTRSGNYPHYGWTFGINSTGYPWLLFSSNGTVYVETTSNIKLTTNRWYLFTFGVDNSTQKQFLIFDGTRFESTQTGLNPDTTLSLNLFRHIDPLTYTQGTLSNIQFYNRALSASEVLQNYNAQKGRFGL
jgi:hypothetical protein